VAAVRGDVARLTDELSREVAARRRAEDAARDVDAARLRAEQSAVDLANRLAAAGRDRDAAHQRATQLSEQVSQLAAALAGLGDARRPAPVPDRA
jgi:hypothetical protein